MKFDISALDSDLLPGTFEIAADYDVQIGTGVKITTFYSDKLSVASTANEIRIGYSEKHEFFRGLVNAFAGNTICQESQFKHLTYMNDCSRCAVPLVETVKKLIRILAACGYDRLQLYTEDTYKINNQPLFGYLRGAYQEDELKEIDSYAQLFGIELIPCIQTLGHLENIFRWEAFQPIHDCNEVLLCDCEATYILIDDMFAQLARTFTSRLVHIGMDEAHAIGLGSHLEKYGYENRTSIFLRHLKRVIKIAEKYGFSCQMWSDMFFRLAYGGDYYNPEIGKNDINVEVPAGVELVYWDYYHIEESHYDKMIDSHKKLGSPICFAGGAWKWVGFSPLNEFSLIAGKAALDSCIKKEISDIILTTWGDNGGESSIFSVLPSIIYYGERRYNGQFELSFKAITGCDLQDFMLLDLPNKIDEHPRYAYKTNFNKIFLYNDILLGIYDDCAKKETRTVYEKALYKLNSAKHRAGQYRYLFEIQIKLLKILLIKYDIGKKIQTAYLQKDFSELHALCIKLKDIEHKISSFHTLFSAHWYAENKPNGMEIHDGRLGWLLYRTRTCRKRIENFIAGKISSLPELEEERILKHDLSGHEFFNVFWNTIVSVNKV